MVKIGDDWKDVIVYLKCRREHLKLEMQKVPFTMPEKDRDRAIKKLAAKIEEINHTLNVVSGDIKEHAKFEYSKVKYLQKLKMEHLKPK